jgi:hypothetical protein
MKKIIKSSELMKLCFPVIIFVPSDEEFVTTLQFLWQYSHFMDYRH